MWTVPPGVCDVTVNGRARAPHAELFLQHHLSASAARKTCHLTNSRFSLCPHVRPARLPAAPHVTKVLQAFRDEARTHARSRTQGARGTKPYLDPHIAVGSQGRVIQARRGSFTNRPLEGCRRPQHDAPPKFQQRHDGAESTVAVNQAPKAQNSDLQRNSDEQ